MIITSEKLDIKQIKLVIWDLDNTFWEGTISEGDISFIDDNVELVKELSRRGIVNSICSKNDFEPCEKKLREAGVWDYFVFPSIDWTPKNLRVHEIISDMQLRPTNVLFLDDEPANLQRALMVNDALLCGTADELCSQMKEQLLCLPIDDTTKRLHQYRDLQVKVSEKKNYDSDEEFLRIADIKVDMREDCLVQVDRICELVSRTNQLNYTKKRSKKEEILSLIEDENVRCGYISCVDKFCDYGIVGFYAVNKKDNYLIHFLFSCRTIGMGIEQYVYSALGFPKLNIVGDVVTLLDNKGCPDWISKYNKCEAENKIASSKVKKILIKGPCDVSQISPFFSKDTVFDDEFAYISKEKLGMYIESFNHTNQILLINDCTLETKNELIETIPFIDNEFFDTKLFIGEYDYIIFSMLTDYSLGLYRHKKNDRITVAFGQYTVDYTLESNWNNVASNWLQNSDDKKRINEEYLYFANNYEPIGRISDEELLQNLQKIRDLVPEKTKIIFLNGAETRFKGECKPSYIDRHILHKHMNNVLENFVLKNSDNCFIIDVNKYLQNDTLYLDTINHYKKIVYYKLANAIQKYITSEDNDYVIKTKHPIYIYTEKIKNKCIRLIKRIVRFI